MAERKYVGDYIAEKVSEEYERRCGQEIEEEKQRIADYFSKEIVEDIMSVNCNI